MTRHPWTRLFALCCIIGTFGVALLAHATVAQAQTYPVAHDNSDSVHNWTHGDPNIGIAPKQYYYLKAIAPATGTIVGNCEVYTPFRHLNLRLEDADKHILAQSDFYNSGGRVFAVGLKPGAMYQCRIANLGTEPVKDYAELNPFAEGDMTTSDCGGPGPVLDPNWDTHPMEPAHTEGLPANGCNGIPGADPFNATDPRANLPTQESIDLGVNTGTRMVRFTTLRQGDLTAFVTFGHQGTKGTLRITDTNGNTLNGPKWGLAEPNPQTENQEYVGADAGVQPPGTYEVWFTGPANTQRMYALVGAV